MILYIRLIRFIHHRVASTSRPISLAYYTTRLIIYRATSVQLYVAYSHSAAHMNFKDKFRTQVASVEALAKSSRPSRERDQTLRRKWRLK